MPVDADKWQHCMCSDTELIGGIEEWKANQRD